uniref:Uncharacterized protein n=1 Tax=Arundo donax TaxID=35708 RepID=A0A0A8XSS3_ARUDO
MQLPTAFCGAIRTNMSSSLSTSLALLQN